ncbi:MAG: hypothetical protein ACHQWU_15165 [Gemmatimonadales bacterium]
MASANHPASEPTGRELLRHTLATLAYRGGKALRGAPPDFSSYRAGATSRSAGEILAHLCDLMAWGQRMARGDKSWADSTPREWGRDVDRFFNEVAAFDACLASDDALLAPAERVFQGPIADALTHVGQIALLRRLAGHQIRAENYSVAAIERGRVGLDQAAPKREFD